MRILLARTQIFHLPDHFHSRNSSATDHHIRTRIKQPKSQQTTRNTQKTNTSTISTETVAKMSNSFNFDFQPRPRLTEAIGVNQNRYSRINFREARVAPVVLAGTASAEQVWIKCEEVAAETTAENTQNELPPKEESVKYLKSEKVQLLPQQDFTLQVPRLVPADQRKSTYDRNVVNYGNFLLRKMRAKQEKEVRLIRSMDEVLRLRANPGEAAKLSRSEVDSIFAGIVGEDLVRSIRTANESRQKSTTFEVRSNPVNAGSESPDSAKAILKAISRSLEAMLKFTPTGQESFSSKRKPVPIRPKVVDAPIKPIKTTPETPETTPNRLKVSPKSVQAFAGPSWTSPPASVLPMPKTFSPSSIASPADASHLLDEPLEAIPWIALPLGDENIIDQPLSDDFEWFRLEDGMVVEAKTPENTSDDQDFLSAPPSVKDEVDLESDKLEVEDLKYSLEEEGMYSFQSDLDELDFLSDVEELEWSHKQFDDEDLESYVGLEFDEDLVSNEDLEFDVEEVDSEIWQATAEELDWDTVQTDSGSF